MATIATRTMASRGDRRRRSDLLLSTVYLTSIRLAVKDVNIISSK